MWSPHGKGGNGGCHEPVGPAEGRDRVRQELVRCTFIIAALKIKYIMLPEFLIKIRIQDDIMKTRDAKNPKKTIQENKQHRRLAPQKTGRTFAIKPAKAVSKACTVKAAATTDKPAKKNTAEKACCLQRRLLPFLKKQGRGKTFRTDNKTGKDIYVEEARKDGQEACRSKDTRTFQEESSGENKKSIGSRCSKTRATGKRSW